MSAIARIVSQRLAVRVAPKRNISISAAVKEATREETWPFVVGMILTGAIVWKATPSSKSEYAKHSKFQQRVDGTLKHDHH